jgi:glyoxylase-like metal-dependent hydrolase (beta-lactamase superfamily II)
MLKIRAFSLGPAITNAYLISDVDTQDTLVIDPAWDGHVLLNAAAKDGRRISSIWLTHAHFDHFGGLASVVDGSNPSPPVALHPEDYPLWRAQGGAAFFGYQIDPGPEPLVKLYHGQQLHLGNHVFEVRHAPGHTLGHVMFYCSSEKVVFCGDVIFRGSIGRTDLPGGSFESLIKSIRDQVLTLPDDTRLLSGHGPESTVGVERKSNPFLI